MGMKLLHSVILDTSPLLNNIPAISSLLVKCEKLYTVQSVIDEIRDANARSRLETTTLPFLIIRSPKPESIKFVSEFSRKTGDYNVLSKTDVQILALAYELDCERNCGDWRLRNTPGQKALNGSPPTVSGTSLNGQNDQSLEDQTPSASVNVMDLHKLSLNAEDRTNEESSEMVVPMVASRMTKDIEKLEITEHNTIDEDLSSSEATPPRSSSEASDPESEGWITPSNLKKQQLKDQNTSTAPLLAHEFMQVATITSDFAMQVRM